MESITKRNKRNKPALELYDVEKYYVECIALLDEVFRDIGISMSELKWPEFKTVSTFDFEISTLVSMSNSYLIFDISTYTRLAGFKNIFTRGVGYQTDEFTIDWLEYLALQYYNNGRYEYSYVSTMLGSILQENDISIQLVNFTSDDWNHIESIVANSEKYLKYSVQFMMFHELSHYLCSQSIYSENDLFRWLDGQHGDHPLSKLSELSHVDVDVLSKQFLALNSHNKEEVLCDILGVVFLRKYLDQFSLSDFEYEATQYVDIHAATYALALVGFLNTIRAITASGVAGVSLTPKDRYSFFYFLPNLKPDQIKINKRCLDMGFRDSDLDLLESEYIFENVSIVSNKLIESDVGVKNIFDDVIALHPEDTDFQSLAKYHLGGEEIYPLCESDFKNYKLEDPGLSVDSAPEKSTGFVIDEELLDNLNIPTMTLSPEEEKIFQVHSAAMKRKYNLIYDYVKKIC